MHPVLQPVESTNNSQNQLKNLHQLYTASAADGLCDTILSLPTPPKMQIWYKRLDASTAHMSYNIGPVVDYGEMDLALLTLTAASALFSPLPSFLPSRSELTRDAAVIWTSGGASFPSSTRLPFSSD